MRGMQGMQGQQGMQGMQGMPMMPPDPEDEEPEIREKQVQQALEFVSKPEVMPKEDEEEEERQKKMEQITQYLDKNMGLNEDEMNAVLKRSGLDPKAGDSTTDSDQSSSEESDEELDFEQQQNRDMRGAIPLPITLSIVALMLSVPDHNAWWRWVIGSPIPTVGQPLQQQLRPGSGASAAHAMTPPLVVINQPPVRTLFSCGPAGNLVGLTRVCHCLQLRSGIAAKSSCGARRWMLTLIGAWFVITFVRTHWATAFQPYVRATVATLATMMGLVRSVPDGHICTPPSLAIHWFVPVRSSVHLPVRSSVHLSLVGPLCRKYACDRRLTLRTSWRRSNVAKTLASCASSSATCARCSSRTRRARWTSSSGGGGRRRAARE